MKELIWKKISMEINTWGINMCRKDLSGMSLFFIAQPLLDPVN